MYKPVIIFATENLGKPKLIVFESRNIYVLKHAPHKTNTAGLQSEGQRHRIFIFLLMDVSISFMNNVIVSKFWFFGRKQGDDLQNDPFRQQIDC